MPVTVSTNAQHDVAVTNFGKNGFHFEVIFSNENKDNPTSCGLITVRKAPETNTFKNPCTIFYIVLEGEIDLEDQAKPGEQVILKAGDVVRIDEGTVVRWTSPTHGKIFFAAELPADVNGHDHVV